MTSTTHNRAHFDDKMQVTAFCHLVVKGSVNFKFGVLFAKDGQLTDDEMFSNGECPHVPSTGGDPTPLPCGPDGRH